MDIFQFTRGVNYNDSRGANDNDSRCANDKDSRGVNDNDFRDLQRTAYLFSGIKFINLTKQNGVEHSFDLKPHVDCRVKVLLALRKRFDLQHCFSVLKGQSNKILTSIFS